MENFKKKFLNLCARRYFEKYSINVPLKKHDIVGYINDDVTRETLLAGGQEIKEWGGVIQFLLNKNIKLDEFIDCGANIGTTTIQVSNHFDNIYSLEPLPKTYEILKLNTSDLKNVKIMNLGVSDAIGDGIMNYGPGFLCGASLHDQAGSVECINVKLSTLDHIFKNHIFNYPPIIKLDIEGHEYQALKGANNILKTYQPIVILEINRNQILNGSSDAFKLLQSYGYKFHNPQPKYKLNKIIRYLPVVRDLLRNDEIEIIKINKLVSKNYSAYGVGTLYKTLVCLPSNAGSN